MRAFRRKMRFGQHSGITLLELLIVMVILLMITAAAIPIIAPATRNRQMRESTRLVSSYLGAARARAVQTGRPAGVMIERFNGGAFALQMSQIEVPPPYSGDVVNSKATVVAVMTPPSPETEARATATWPFVKWFTATISAAEFNHKLVRIGDRIQFGGQGHIYTIYGPDEPAGSEDGVADSATLEIAYVSNIDFTGKVVFPWENNGPPSPLPVPQTTPYKIFRQPVRTITPPLVLPEGIVVDLSVSGVGSGRFNVVDYPNTVPSVPVPTVTDPVAFVPFDPQIIFSPSGRLEWVTRNDGVLAHPTDPVFLLMGRRELMSDVTATRTDKDIVFQNLSAIPVPPDVQPPPAENFWVTIGYQSGLVTVSEVAPNFQDYQDLGGSAYTSQNQLVSAAISQARTFAKQSQSVGGR